MKKILIFYASFGGGHLSAANSIKQYIEQNYPEDKVEIVDCMLYVDKILNKISTDAYANMTKSAPWLWARMYAKAEKGALSTIASSSFNMLSLKLIKLFNELDPDIVISTHPFSGQMVSHLKKKGKIKQVTLATVLTDFAPHDQWLIGHEYTDFFFVAHNKMKKMLVDYGIDESKIFATGIPLSNRFLLNFDRDKIKDEFGLDHTRKTILFFAGGELGLGKEKTVAVLKSFIKHGKDNCQIVAISGKNEKMKEKFEELVYDENASSFVKVLGYTKMVPELMSISDLVVTKPGGLTVTESLASGLPLVVINPIPGQEIENAEFLENSGVAIWIKKESDVDKEIKNLLSDESAMFRMKINSKLLAKKNSTKDICNTILDNSKEL